MNDLLILGCSGTKRETDGVLPAFELYDGPFYLVLRKFLREYEWPRNLSISVLSAKHELFGALKEIGTYDKRLTRDAAALPNNPDPHRLDSDGDGEVCESLPGGGMY